MLPTHNYLILIRDQNCWTFSGSLQANPSGGVYVSLDGLLANDPPANVQQVFFDLFEFEAATHYVDDLDTMAKLLVDGRLRLFVDRTYTFADALQGSVVHFICRPLVCFSVALPCLMCVCACNVRGVPIGTKTLRKVASCPSSPSCPSEDVAEGSSTLATTSRTVFRRRTAPTSVLKINFFC